MQPTTADGEPDTFDEICAILNREPLTELQVALLVADILVGDITVAYYETIEERTRGTPIATNARRIINYVARTRRYL